jgi:membrane fusion protein, multidrug efflux system
MNRYTMKRIQTLLLVAATATMFSCSQSDDSQKLVKELEKYQKEIKELEAKVEETRKKINEPENVSETLYQEPVVVETLSPETFRHYFEANGAIVPVDEAFISPEISGQIIEIAVKEGQRVVKGQLLAKLNTEVTEKSIAEIKTSLELATDVFERQQRLWEQKIGSEMQYLEAKNRKTSLENSLETIKAQLRMAMIFSPVNGIVEKVNQKKGEQAMPGMQLMRVVSLDEVIVRADVSERFLPYINKGDEVELLVPSYPDFRIKTTIHRTGNVVNMNNRTFEVELKVKNPDEMLKPNMISVIVMNDFTADSAIVVPTRIIKEDLKGKYVYVAIDQQNNMVARKKYISPGISYQNKTMVINGLFAQEKIITDGYNRVNDGMLINVRN